MTIAYSDVGTADNGTTTVSPAYPADVNAGDFLVMVVVNKYPTNGPTTPKDWYLADQVSGGAGASGLDSGNVYVTVFTRTATGTETGTVTVSIGSGNAALATIVGYRSSTVAPIKLAWAVSGADNTSGTAWSVTTGLATYAAGDRAVVCSGTNTDAGAFSGHGLTMTGATIGSGTERADSGTTAGDDVRLAVADFAITAGAGTAAATYTATLSSAAAGASVVLLLRELTGETATGDPYGLRFAVNGSETDTDVENDSVPWVEKLVHLRIAGGGGGPARSANLWGASFELAIPPHLAPKVRTVTVGVQGPKPATMPAYAYDTGNHTACRVVFAGAVQSSRHELPAGVPVEFDALDDMSGYMARRSRCAAANASGIDELLAAIDAEITDANIDGEDQFPTATDQFWDGTLMTIYRPDQGDTSNRDYVSQALAGTGINLSAHWYGNMGSNTMYYRPDYYYPGVTATNRAEIYLIRPRLYTYTDCGFTYSDHYARVEVTGKDSAAVNYFGWARLDHPTDRQALGNRELNLAGYWNNAARCKGAALTILSQLGYPSFTHPFRMSAYPNAIYDGLDSWTGDRGTVAFNLAAVMLGDRVSWPTVGDTHYEDPATGLSADTFSAIENMMDVGLDTAGPNAAGAYDGATLWHTVRAVEREWTPDGGWLVTIGTWPETLGVDTDTTNDAGSGTA